MTSQLQIDLRNRTIERVRQVVKDTFSLFDMAGLSDEDAGMCLSEVMLIETAIVIANGGAHSDIVGITLQCLIKKYRGEINESEFEQLVEQYTRFHVSRG